MEAQYELTDTLHASLSMFGTELYDQSTLVNKILPNFFTPKSWGQAFQNFV